jgi:uncharacterized damage-inducible protein DinB
MIHPSHPAITKDTVFGDIERELAATRRVLERLPEEHYSWKPHPKSMSLGELGSHVVNLLFWQLVTVQGEEFDLASSPPPAEVPATREELLRAFDKNASEVKKALQRIDPSALGNTWTLRRGEQVLLNWPRAMVLRIWGINHMIHHRGQLCVYLRLLNVPVPAVYLNSVDEPAWVFE